MFKKINLENGTQRNVIIAIILGATALLLCLLRIFLHLPVEYFAMFFWMIASFQATKGKKSTASNKLIVTSYVLVIVCVPVILYLAGTTFLTTIKVL